MPRETEQQRMERELDRITELCTYLRNYETDRPFGYDGERALRIVRRIFSEHSRWIPDGTVALYYGSLLFNDFNKLDADVLIVHSRPLSGRWTRRTVKEEESAFQSLPDWPVQNKYIADIGFTDMETLKQDARTYHKGIRLRRNISPIDAGIILHAALLIQSSNQSVLLEQFQSEVMELGSMYPQFRKSVIDRLQLVLRNRQERRGFHPRFSQPFQR